MHREANMCKCKKDSSTVTAIPKDTGRLATLTLLVRLCSPEWQPSSLKREVKESLL